MRLVRLLLAGLSCQAASGMSAPAPAGTAASADVVIYGATSAGIAAAVQVARMGRSVVLLEPTGRLGGLTTGGLGATDIGNKAAIGGIAREFYRRVRMYYREPSAWRWQRPEEYKSAGQATTDPAEETQWTFEPRAALQIFRELLHEHGVTVAHHEPLDRRPGAGVRKEGKRIVALRTTSGREFRGRVFIDASYEGDLMAAAGVSYRVGREAEAEYGETLNGVRLEADHNHFLCPGVSAYLVAGNPGSGLLPGIDPTGPGREGDGDRRVQAYNFRLCLTDHPDNRIAFAKPEGYREEDFELLFRNFEAGENRIPMSFSPMPNRKTDTNNKYGFSTDYIGWNYDYPEADDATRQRLFTDHRRYTQGLMWSLANHPRVPAPIRETMSRWGVSRDEFPESGGWPDQLYVREARRMTGALVMTQHHCQGREIAPDPVGLAAYTMDSHNVRRWVTPEGFVRNEGNVEVGGFAPYPIGYGSITPRAEECENLLVPACLAATHIAFGSIRMEPVFMVLGQSAATAAVHAVAEGVSVQAVDRARLRERLLADAQILSWAPPPR